MFHCLPNLHQTIPWSSISLSILMLPLILPSPFKEVFLEFPSLKEPIRLANGLPHLPKLSLSHLRTPMYMSSVYFGTRLDRKGFEQPLQSLRIPLYFWSLMWHPLSESRNHWVQLRECLRNQIIRGILMLHWTWYHGRMVFLRTVVVYLLTDYTVLCISSWSHQIFF